MAKVRAPEIARPGLRWFNVPAPLSLADLAGKLVILDFWTLCCINCIQLLPALKRVEEAFPRDVVVIGVHSPKFPAERDPRNVDAAIARYGIRHPVVHDPDFQLWKQYAVRAWPTLVIVGPDARVIGQHAGEADPDALLRAVGDALSGYGRAGLLEPAALELDLPPAPSGRLAFPGKLRPLTFRGRKAWVLADAGHNQVLVLSDEGEEILRYGSGEAGFLDGAGAEARFDRPQGVAADAASIHVADTGNHAVRRIALADGTVTTLAGTGRRGRPLGEEPAPGFLTALASPWDILPLGGMLVFANAGTHQLGRIDIESGSVSRLAGAGPEGLRDGPAPDAHLAQPSGLALSPDGRTVWFADAETSAVRALDLERAEVRTLAGSGLFDFGHVNGPLAEARFQHCLGVAGWDGKILVADSYNGALRVLDPAGGTVSDLDDACFTCTDPVCLPLAEPAGAVADGVDRILVSDTNNHRILEYLTGASISHTWFE
jgi:thiol-disulfide isomerase/thioredoxin